MPPLNLGTPLNFIFFILPFSFLLAAQNDWNSMSLLNEAYVTIPLWCEYKPYEDTEKKRQTNWNIPKLVT